MSRMMGNQYAAKKHRLYRVLCSKAGVNPMCVNDQFVKAANKMEIKLNQYINSNQRHWWQMMGGKDPELIKVYGLILDHISEIRRFQGRSGIRANATVIQQVVEELDTNLDALTTTDSAWQLADFLKRQLLLIGDNEYLCNRFYQEMHREADGKKQDQPGKYLSEFFSEAQIIEIQDAITGGSLGDEERTGLIEGLTAMYLARSDNGRHRTARSRIKERYFLIVGMAMAVLLAVLIVVISNAGGGDVLRATLIAATSGAAGGAIASLIKLRDRIVRIEELKTFYPSIFLQPFLGAISGIILFVILVSGLIKIANIEIETNSWEYAAIFGFVAGFSEPFFLRTIDRIVSLSDDKTEKSK